MQSSILKNDQESRLKKKVLMHNIMGISECQWSKNLSKALGDNSEEEEILNKVKLAENDESKFNDKEWSREEKKERVWLWKMIKMGNWRRKNLLNGMKISLFKF